MCASADSLAVATKRITEEARLVGHEACDSSVLLLAIYWQGLDYLVCTAM